MIVICIEGSPVGSVRLGGQVHLLLLSLRGYGGLPMLFLLHIELVIVLLHQKLGTNASTCLKSLLLAKHI